MEADKTGLGIPGLEQIEDYVAEYSAKPSIPMLPAAEDEQDKDQTDWQTRHKEREAKREEIRNRVRNSTASNEYFHKGMPMPTISDTDDKVVAVYARVSTKSTDQTSSIENQQKYYTKKINENEHWEMQEIYSDEGKSGMEANHRHEFQRMISDASKGRMDLILCASVSRFARNISDCIRYITKLKTMNPHHPVGVYFETENIYTLDPNSEQILHFHALLADWESANKSRRMILSYDQRICTGQYPVADLLGYRHTKDGELIIQEDEAKTVRFVFLSLIVGKSCEEIAEILTEKGRTTLKGNVEWDGGMVRGLTLNERRWGDLEARKTIVVDPKEKIIVKNNGIRDWAFVPGHHEGIVSPEIAKAAQYMTSARGMLENGIPVLSVIPTGALKGFVSVCPRWNGIDRDTFFKACESVYEDDELEALRQELRIWSGEDHSNVLSMSFTGYQVPRGIFFLNKSMPTMTITNKSIKFNKACHDRLDICEWVEILYHPILQAVILREGSPEQTNSFRWITDRGKNVVSISTKAFSQAVYESQHWIKDYQFRFRGITKERNGYKLIIFSLDEPQILIGNKVADNTDCKGLSAYIPYRTDDSGKESDIGSAAYAYPQEWEKRRVGVNCYARRKRDEAVSAITMEDILNKGRVIDNPLIGSIPSRQELLNELDELLMSM